LHPLFKHEATSAFNYFPGSLFITVLQHINKKMKKLLITFSIASITVTAVAQNNIGIGTSTPNASAMFDINSTSKRDFDA